jgi:hypothetical protein
MEHQVRPSELGRKPNKNPLKIDFYWLQSNRWEDSLTRTKIISNKSRTCGQIYLTRCISNLI